MMIEQHISLIEDILGRWQSDLGDDLPGYKNHVYRMVNFCLALREHSAEEREKIVIAGCFHDLGIWSGKTFDYLPPSIILAKDYLRETEKHEWIDEIELMIDTHHKLRKYRDTSQTLVEVFRQGDLVDFSLGIVKCGLSANVVKDVKAQFPNAGFHKRLVQLAAKRFVLHPLDPLPVLKW